MAYVGVGANLGDAVASVRDAIARLGSLPGTHMARASSLYRSAPHEADGPDFVNAVVQLHTELGAHELLEHLQALEREAGRQRPYRNAPRTLDLDLLLYDDARLATATLTLPHPRMDERAFVLVPLAEIAPGRVTAEALARVATQRIESID